MYVFIKPSNNFRKVHFPLPTKKKVLLIIYHNSHPLPRGSIMFNLYIIFLIPFYENIKFYILLTFAHENIGIVLKLNFFGVF